MGVNWLYISYTSIKLVYKETYREDPWGPVDRKRKAPFTEKERKEAKAEMVTSPVTDEKSMSNTKV